MAFPKYGSVPTYAVERYGKFRVGDEADLWGIRVRITALTNIPGGVSASVERVTRIDGVNTWTDAACNLRPLSGCADAFARGQYDAQKERSPLFVRRAKGITVEIDDPQADDWTDAMRGAYCNGYEMEQS